MPPQKNDEKPSAFKHWINEPLLKKMATEIKAVYPAFDASSFLSIKNKLAPLELKDRVRLVRDQLHHNLPPEFPKAIRILLKSLKRDALKGFDLWPYTEFVQTYGLEFFDDSMAALYELTQRFTSEFAVRPFIKKDLTRTLALLEKWTADPSEHVRRWASEGSRPRLPWGEKLDAIHKNPKLTLKILEKLKEDESMYVRKSVANHLNDFSKEHPDLLVKTLQTWQKKTKKEHQEKIDWIIRHSLRTLIKQGHRGALSLLGVNSDAKIEISKLKLNKNKFKLEEIIHFEFDLKSESKQDQKLIVDYVIHHVKSNKTRSPKVFKLNNVVLKSGETIRISKRHALRLVTTRKYYPGVHLLEIQVNGTILGQLEWNLLTQKTYFL